MVKRSEDEAVRNRDLSGALYQKEAAKAATEHDLNHHKREEEGLRLENGKLCSNLYDLRNELEALRGHCNVLAGQNVGLNSELERFVESDEEIRRNLNRRPRVEHMKQK